MNTETNTFPITISASALAKGDRVIFGDEVAVIEHSGPSTYPGLLAITYHYQGRSYQAYTGMYRTTERFEYAS